MYLTRAEINILDKERLLAFLGKGIPEGHHIDYKVSLSGDSKTKQYREFLKDITAFANANGGHIFLGVKEPSDSMFSYDQIVSIPSGDSIAQDLERLASSGAVDPRISGLIICPVLIEPDRWVVVIHVPPSLGRPHMVVYEKQSNFYIRHSESIQKMTSFDIRQAVLTSAAAEEQAKAYASTQRSRLSKAFLQSSPGFILQATPLILPESPIDVFADKVIEALRGSNRNSRHGGYQMGLGSMPHPKPTVEGVEGADNSKEPQWLSEFHRNGYTGVAFRLTEYDRLRQQQNGPYCLQEHHQHLFLSFGELCDSIVSVSEFDPPYVVDCTFENSKNSYFILSQVRHSDPCERESVSWPSAIKNPGESFLNVMDDFIKILYNVYGFRREEITQQG